MFKDSNPFISYLKSRFPQASDFRFKNLLNGPQILYHDGLSERVEYVPVLCWRVDDKEFMFAPDPKFNKYTESISLFGQRSRTVADYSEAYDVAIEAIEASINSSIDEFNKRNISKYPTINGRQVRF